jgi:hypothetical protein
MFLQTRTQDRARLNRVSRLKLVAAAGFVVSRLHSSGNAEQMLLETEVFARELLRIRIYCLQKIVYFLPDLTLAHKVRNTQNDWAVPSTLHFASPQICPHAQLIPRAR